MRVGEHIYLIESIHAAARLLRYAKFSGLSQAAVFDKISVAKYFNCVVYLHSISIILQ